MDLLSNISMNINGMQTAVKRRAVFSMLRRERFDIILLQETHCTERLASIWRTEWGGQTYFSNRGIQCSLIRKGADIKVNQVKKDKDGQVLFLQIKQDNMYFVIVKV